MKQGRGSPGLEHFFADRISNALWTERKRVFHGKVGGNFHRDPEPDFLSFIVSEHIC